MTLSSREQAGAVTVSIMTERKSVQMHHKYPVVITTTNVKADGYEPSGTTEALQPPSGIPITILWSSTKMTKKQWYKLKLEVKLGKLVSADTILNKTGWCWACKHYTYSDPVYFLSRKAYRSKCKYHKQKICKPIRISTIDSFGDIVHYSWYSHYHPSRFDD